MLFSSVVPPKTASPRLPLFEPLDSGIIFFFAGSTDESGRFDDRALRVRPLDSADGFRGTPAQDRDRLRQTVPGQKRLPTQETSPGIPNQVEVIPAPGFKVGPGRLLPAR